MVALPAFPAATASARDLVKSALESPVNFEPLRRALTPDDHVCLVLDERLPHLGAIIAGILDHLVSAGIDPDAVTLLSPSPGGSQEWIDALPDEFADVKTEVHHADDRHTLAYVATTKAGERLYLNRTAAQADFLIAVSAHRHGERGESLLIPGLCDRELQKSPPDTTECLWLLGTPFFVRAIEGGEGEIYDIVAGFTDSCDEADRRRNRRWTSTVRVQPETVFVMAPSNRFEELTTALAHAESIVAPGGRVIAVMNEATRLPVAMETVQRAQVASEAERPLKKQQPPGWQAAKQWADVATTAALFIVGPLSRDACEELFATAVESEAELQRLLDGGGRILKLDDAHLARVQYQQ